MRADVVGGQPVDAVKAAERAADVVRAAKRLVESEAERERVAQGVQQLRDTGLDALGATECARLYAEGLRRAAASAAARVRVAKAVWRGIREELGAAKGGGSGSQQRKAAEQSSLAQLLSTYVADPQLHNCAALNARLGAVAALAESLAQGTSPLQRLELPARSLAPLLDCSLCLHFFAAAEPESAAHRIIASTAAGFGLARELAGPRHASGVAEEPVPSPDVVAAADHCLQGLEWTVKQS